MSGVNYLNGNKYPLLFPKDMVDFVHVMSKDKVGDYYFKGVISDKREWIKGYENKGTIVNSFYGRNSSTKYILDEEYYFRLIDQLLQQQLPDAMLLYDQINRKGFEGDTVLEGFAEFIRNLLVCKDEKAMVLLDVA
jgi:hypothetical protein